MRQLLAMLFLQFLTSSLAFAGDQEEPYKKFSGTYWIYGGELSEPRPPTMGDKKIVFSINGQLAKELFDAIGPDKHDVCTEGSGIRMRWQDKRNLLCSRSKEGEYECNFGFDLRTGKGIRGSIC